jgi:hypothetical protein
MPLADGLFRAKLKSPDSIVVAYGFNRLLAGR